MRGVALTVVLAAAAADARAATGIDDALELLDAWQLEEAKAAAEALLAADPENPEAWYLAGRVQHARGEHVAALSLLRAAEAAGVAEAGYVRPLAESSAAYAAHFQTLETEHFRIRYLDKDEIVAAYAAPVLEAAYRAIGSDLELAARPGDEKIAVEVFPDARGLAGATGLTIQEIETSGTIAVCKFNRLMITSPLATADGYDWADTVAHELAHLIISKKSRNTIPIWLHEGIAKFFESRWRGKAGEALSPYAEKLLADAVRAKKFITYQQMHPSMAKLPSQEDAALAFAEVFTTIEYLAGSYGARSIPQVLALTADGVELEAALRKVYGMGLAGIEAAWKRYLKTRPFREVPGAKPRPIRLATSEKEAETARPLEAMADREVHDLARLGELLQLGGHPRAAVIEYEKAYAKAGVTYSTLVYRLARAYLDTERHGDALAILDEALAVHPNESDIHLLAGRARLARRDLAGAQRHFEAVRLQNPYNPEIHEALRLLYEAKGDEATAAREAHFLELSRHPRPTRRYELPQEPAAAATLNIVAVPFGTVQLDGRALPAPTWRHPVEPGTHRLARGDEAQTVQVAAGESRTVVLD